MDINKLSTSIENYQSYTFITIKNEDLEVTLSNLGASIYQIKFHGELMTLTPSNKDDFLHENIYHGKTIGRVANRIKGNEVVINKKTYKLANNEGSNTLHGGINALSNQKFNYVIRKNDNSVKVTFHYLDKEKDIGFPGNLDVYVTYLLTKTYLKISFKANVDKLSMCSLTNHAYYTLGSNSTKELKLCIKSHKYLNPNPADLLPLDIKEVDKVMDFSSLRRINRFIKDPYLINSKSNGYDHYYYFDNVNPKIAQIKLANKKYKMSIYTDFPGVQIYTDNYKTKEVFAQSDKLVRRGIAIEPSQSQKEFHYLNKDETYNHFIKLVFAKK